MYAALAIRSYGEGKICIHTDRVGAIQTGHRDNPKLFWRRVFEMVTSKNPNELIRVGIIISTPNSSPDRINSFSPISARKIDLPDLAIIDISQFDCLYFAGLPDAVTTVITSKIEAYVRDGGGLIIESPDRGGENINVLTGIENIYCESSERPIDTFAYWTEIGANSYAFYEAVSIAFMTTLKEEVFSSTWSILMNDVPTTVTATTAPSSQSLNLGSKGVFEFGVGFTSAMQDGLVTLETGEESSSSSSSISSSSSSSSSSTEWMSTSSSSSSSSSSSGPPPLFVAGGQGTNTIAYSSDGVTWTASSNGNSMFSVGYGVCWNGSKFVAGGWGANTIAYSSDGVTWTASSNGNSMFSSIGRSVCSRPAPNMYPPIN